MPNETEIQNGLVICSFILTIMAVLMMMDVWCCKGRTLRYMEESICTKPICRPCKWVGTKVLDSVLCLCETGASCCWHIENIADTIHSFWNPPQRHSRPPRPLPFENLLSKSQVKPSVKPEVKLEGTGEPKEKVSIVVIKEKEAIEGPTILIM